MLISVRNADESARNPQPPTCTVCAFYGHVTDRRCEADFGLSDGSIGRLYEGILSIVANSLWQNRARKFAQPVRPGDYSLFGFRSHVVCDPWYASRGEDSSAPHSGTSLVFDRNLQ